MPDRGFRRRAHPSQCISAPSVSSITRDAISVSFSLFRCLFSLILSLGLSLALPLSLSPTHTPHARLRGAKRSPRTSFPASSEPLIQGKDRFVSLSFPPATLFLLSSSFPCQFLIAFFFSVKFVSLFPFVSLFWSRV